MNGIIAGALLLVAARPVQSTGDDPNLRQIQAMLAKPAVMCGRFEQAKTLVGLRRPVRSSGRFCVLLDKGVLWTTVLPFPATLRLTKDEIVESHGAQVTKRLSAREEPTVGIINDLLFSLLQGDLGRLTSSFSITSTVGRGEWSAKLVPNDGGMKHVIGGIELNGGAYVRQITIREASGDATEISFSSIVTGPTALLPEESRQFELPVGGAPHPDGHER
jgi:hypothetical protein